MQELEQRIASIEFHVPTRGKRGKPDRRFLSNISKNNLPQYYGGKDVGQEKYPFHFMQSKNSSTCLGLCVDNCTNSNAYLAGLDLTFAFLIGL